jgi:hypothetical protein
VYDHNARSGIDLRKEQEKGKRKRKREEKRNEEELFVNDAPKPSCSSPKSTAWRNGASTQP